MPGQSRICPVCKAGYTFDLSRQESIPDMDKYIYRPDFIIRMIFVQISLVFLTFNLEDRELKGTTLTLPNFCMFLHAAYFLQFAARFAILIWNVNNPSLYFAKCKNHIVVLVVHILFLSVLYQDPAVFILIHMMILQQYYISHTEILIDINHDQLV